MTGLPKWMTETTKTKANKQEKKLAKDLNLKLTPNSGSTAFRKGDMYTNQFLIESKSTDHESISLKKSWLEKIEEEAILEGKTPLLILEIKGRRYFVLRERDYDLHAQGDSVA